MCSILYNTVVEFLKSSQVLFGCLLYF